MAKPKLRAAAVIEELAFVSLVLEHGDQLADARPIGVEIGQPKVSDGWRQCRASVR